jgi:hypothetical protein
MTVKSLLFVGALGVASLGVASAKSYDIVLSSPAMAGNLELKPGAYHLKIEGSQVVFTDVQTSKSWTAPVKVETGATKFGETTVESTNGGDVAHIHTIDLAGSNTKVEFVQ